MADGTVGNLKVVLGLDSSAFESGMHNAGQSMRTLAADAVRMQMAVQKLDFAAFAGGAQAMNRLGKSAQQAGVQLTTLAQTGSRAAGQMAGAMQRQLPPAYQGMLTSTRGFARQMVSILSQPSLGQAMRAPMAAWVSATKGAMRTLRQEVVAAVGSIQRYVAGVKLQPISIRINRNIALPRFSVRGGFDARTGSVPTVGVRWYDKGGLFTAPQVIGVAERRPEFVGAAEDLKKFVDGAVAAAFARRGSGGGAVAQTLHIHNTFSPREMTADEMQRASVKIQSDIRRAAGMR